MKRTLSFAAFVALLSMGAASCGPKDDDIKKALDEKAAATPEMTGVTTAVKDGVVTLTGQVANDAARTTDETAVKGVKGVKSVVDNLSVMPAPMPAQAMPAVPADDALNKGTADAVKDFPGITANVQGGEITLTGTIERKKLRTLMQSLNSLNPKKINNQLTVK